MSWSMLVRTALLGVERSALSPALSARLAALGINTGSDPVQALLKGAAHYRLLRRAAGKPAPGKKPGFVPADLSQEQLCSDAAANALEKIISGSHTDALHEWLELAIACRRHIPGQYLPVFFEACIDHQMLWDLVCRAMGPRGQWLLRLHPLGIDLYGHENTEDWYTGQRQQRIGILRYWRHQDPAIARELLTATWHQESPADRQVLLAQLQQGLSMADEPFLESCLDDKRKEIRQIAARFLCQLPESALARRLFHSASQILTFHNKKEIQVALPGAMPEHLQRDGIIAKKSGDSDWLWELIARIPPSKWNTHFGSSAQVVCDAMYRSNWSRQLTTSIAKASLQYKDSNWLDAIANLWLAPRSMAQDWKSEWGKQILENLPGEAFNNLLRQALRNATAIEEGSLAYQMLLTPHQYWDDDIAITFVGTLQGRIAASTAYDWGSWHYRHALNNAAYVCRPGLLEGLASGWPVYTPAWNRWAADVKRFEETLKFRKEMQEAFQR